MIAAESITAMQEWMPAIVAIITTVGAIAIAHLTTSRKVNGQIDKLRAENGEQHEAASAQRAAVAARLAGEVDAAKSIALAAVQAAGATTAALVAHAADEERRYERIEVALVGILAHLDLPPVEAESTTLEPKSLNTSLEVAP